MVTREYYFNCDAVDCYSQFETFRREFCALGDLHLPTVAVRGPGFAASAEGYSFGPIKILIWKSDAYAFEPRLVGGGDEDFWQITLRLEGYADIEVNGERVRQEGNALNVCRVGQKTRGYLSSNHSVSLYLPRTQFSALAGILDNLANSVSGGPRLHPLLAHYLSALVGVLPSATQEEANVIAETTESMIHACLVHSKALGSVEEVPLMAARLEIAKRFVSSNIKSVDLTARTLCAKLNVSRRQLYKIFETEGGVEKYVLTSRLKASYEALLRADHSRTITAISEEFGFADSATFSRQFRARFGYSPTDIRSRAGTVDTEFARWAFGAGKQSTGRSSEDCRRSE